VRVVIKKEEGELISGKKGKKKLLFGKQHIHLEGGVSV